MSLIITFMFEPAKLQMNCASASGRISLRAERAGLGASARSADTAPLVRAWSSTRSPADAMQRQGHQRTASSEVASCILAAWDLRCPGRVCEKEGAMPRPLPVTGRWPAQQDGEFKDNHGEHFGLAIQDALEQSANSIRRTGRDARAP